MRIGHHGSLEQVQNRRTVGSRIRIARLVRFEIELEKIMNDREMTGEGRQDFEENPVHQVGGTPDGAQSSDALASKSEAGPSGQRRRTRSRAPAGGVVQNDFDPSSRGDEHGEVM